MEELGRETAALLNFQSVEPGKKFPAQIAFNVIPQIDDFQPNGYTKEEMKLVWETRKILEDESIQVNPTAVRVQVFYRSEEHTSELQSLMSISYDVFCLKKQKQT